MPVASDNEGGPNSGLLLAAADLDAAVTVPGAAPSIAGKVGGAGRSEVQNNASLLGKVPVTRFGDGALNPSDSQELVRNACRYSGGCALEAGFRCCSSRLAVPDARASWFGRHVPHHMSSPEWYLFLAFSELRLSKVQRLQPCRFAVRAPSPQSLCGSQPVRWRL